LFLLLAVLTLSVLDAAALVGIFLWEDHSRKPVGQALFLTVLWSSVPLCVLAFRALVHAASVNDGLAVALAVVAVALTFPLAVLAVMLTAFVLSGPDVSS
jgi:hypothetical protein